MTKPSANIKIFGRKFPMPKSVLGRRVLGIILILGGLLGFLPILGFWMVPLGVLVLSYDSPRIRRLARRFKIWLMRNWQASRFSRTKPNVNKMKKKEQVTRRIT